MKTWWAKLVAWWNKPSPPKRVMTPQDRCRRNWHEKGPAQIKDDTLAHMKICQWSCVHCGVLLDSIMKLDNRSYWEPYRESLRNRRAEVYKNAKEIGEGAAQLIWVLIEKRRKKKEKRVKAFAEHSINKYFGITLIEFFKMSNEEVEVTIKLAKEKMEKENGNERPTG